MWRHSIQFHSPPGIYYNAFLGEIWEGGGKRAPKGKKDAKGRGKTFVFGKGQSKQGQQDPNKEGGGGEPTEGKGNERALGEVD
jgi:hypothetical protein